MLRDKVQILAQDQLCLRTMVEGRLAGAQAQSHCRPEAVIVRLPGWLQVTQPATQP